MCKASRALHYSDRKGRAELQGPRAKRLQTQRLPGCEPAHTRYLRNVLRWVGE